MEFKVYFGKKHMVSSGSPYGGYPPEILADMLEAGYSFFVDGKPWVPGKPVKTAGKDKLKQAIQMEQLAL
jgi:hypothetical protein